jgi:plasmid maintenance system killer protein
MANIGGVPIEAFDFSHPVLVYTSVVYTVNRTPGNRFEALIGDRRGQYSVRINDQWRIYFEWPARSPGPVNVEIVDYH